MWTGRRGLAGADWAGADWAGMDRAGMDWTLTGLGWMHFALAHNWIHDWTDELRPALL